MMKVNTNGTTTRQPYGKATIWRLPQLNNLELLQGTYMFQSFPTHAHDGFALGVIERGAVGVTYRGKSQVAQPGTINVVNPDEFHAEYTVSDPGWTGRMYYFDTVLMAGVRREMAEPARGALYFKAGVLKDVELAGQLWQLHVMLPQGETPLMELETRLYGTLAAMVVRYGSEHAALRPMGQEREVMRKVREYIHAHYADDISINQLARLVNLSPYYLARVFRNEIGVPPHTYLTQVRVRRATRLLAQGEEIARAAVRVGFVDQSHLTRQFKRMHGITPGQYRKTIQD